MTVACGNKTHDRDLAKTHHHESVAQVRLCFSRPGGLESVEEAEFHLAEGRSEVAAEAANEAFFEERGGGTYVGSPEEANDRWLDSLNWDASVTGFQSVGTTPNYLLPRGWRDGVYTVETEAGHRTFRFRTQASDSDFKPGLQIVSFLSGQSNDFARGDYTQFGEVKADGSTKVWSKHRGNKTLEADYLAFLADPAAALAALHCFRCGRLLSTPESIAAGIGPECAKKGI